MSPSHFRITRRVPARALLLLIAASLAPSPGWAEQSLQVQALQQQGLPRAGGGWGATVGVGMAVVPKYNGADTAEARPIPIFSINYDQRVFIGPLGISMAAVRCNGFRAGPVLDYQRGRSESDDPRLAGLGDIPASVTAGLFAAYARGPVEVSATARQAISHSANGLSGLVQINLHHVFPGIRTLVEIGPDLEFGNADHQRVWFGISPAQSLASGLPIYSPRAGINRIGFHAGLTHRLTGNFLWRIFAGFSEVTGDAAQSPIIERRSQAVVGAGLAYHF